jgi:adenylate cyclase
MAEAADRTSKDEALWRRVLTGEHHSRYAFIPSARRCLGCLEPLSGVGGKMLALIGHHSSRKNPNLCRLCDDALPPGGAEVDIAVLFADVRGSTALAEKIGARAFSETLNHFYRVANDILISHDAMIDKMIGDEVMALFIPSICKSQHRRRAAESALALAEAIARENERSGPQLPVGVGVHAGLAFVGKVGTSDVHDFTALGDTVNTAARLQAEAAAGEIALSDAIYQESPALFPGAEQRDVNLRGKAEPLAIRVYRPRGA